MLLYVILLTGSVAMSALLTVWVRSTAVAYGLKATPVYGRHTHTKPLPRLGGIAICVTFMTAALGYIPIARLLHVEISTRNYLGILVPVLLIFFMGAYDDIRPLKPKSKIAVEATAAVLLYFAGFGINYFQSIFHGRDVGRIIDLPLTIFWVLLITNAFNLIDGLDGLAAGSALISAISILAVALVGHHNLIIYLIVVLIGAICGFLPFNSFPASIFMGDSGSLFIGFLLSALAMGAGRSIDATAGAAVPIFAFGLPILDVALAVMRRSLRGHPLFRGDTDHIHHKLQRQGFSHRHAVMVLYAVTAGFVCASLAILLDEKLLVPVVFAVLLATCIGVARLRYPEFTNLFKPAARRRQIVTDEASIRRATEALSTCSDFRTTCQVLQETLQPDGFEGLRLKNLGKDGYPIALFHTLHYDWEGHWYLEWSERKTDDSPWEYSFQLEKNSQGTLGYASFFHMSASEDLRTRADMLAEEFRAALSDAVVRSSNRMRLLHQAEVTANANAELNLVRAACRAAD
ncbi:MAG: undecaprenyl/decaprenyl-phosphate alpha-N-acetylglucosaminyl 1-phosphate transferase [Acidobacteria bacterium]|nr:undecaprenyl/decaprenyl-phosphate alpha-N-acetylglucosaminyl 1-phosphate transferase [Acidobacteriota bacterium]